MSSLDLCWNKVYWFDVHRHVTSFDQSECFIFVKHSYATPKNLRHSRLVLTKSQFFSSFWAQLWNLISWLRNLDHFEPFCLNLERQMSGIDVRSFFKEIYICPKLQNPQKFVLMPEPAQYCKTMLFLNQNYALKLLIAFIMTYFCFST